MELVKNGPKFWEFIRNLRNTKGVRESFIQQKEITDIEQAEYMLKYITTIGYALLISSRQDMLELLIMTFALQLTPITKEKV